VNGAAIDGLATGEAASGSSRHRMGVMCVSVVKIVGVVNDIDVANERIANVDALSEPVPATEPRMERFAKTQREPADSETYSEPEASAEKTNERRTIDRRTEDWARVPAPPAADITPAAVMKWSKAPGRVIYPSPAPRAYVAPIPIAVRRPVGSNLRRVPDRTVVAVLAPGAVVIEILRAGHVLGDVAL
jgi:hypothetical protein